MPSRRKPGEPSPNDTEEAIFDEERAGDLATENLNDAGDAASRLASRDDIDEQTSEELGVDSIVDAGDAGLGGGLDQQEEALLGVTDEEIQAHLERRARQQRDS